jgi:predicted nucleic acid-binding Zn ribbon protein
VIEPAHRQERMAEAKETYLVTSRFFDCVLRTRDERDADELDEGRDEVSSARSGVRVVAIVRAVKRTAWKTGPILQKMTLMEIMYKHLQV